MARTPKHVDLNLNKLCESMYRSRRDLERFRIERKEAVRQYLGAHWSEESTDEKVPLNLISLYIQVVGRSLIPKAPRVNLSTFNKRQKPVVAAMEKWANLEIGKMGLDSTLQRVVIDALFSLGICKVGLLDPAHSSLWGWDTPAGTAFAERVDLDDFVFDTHARDFREAAYIGHRYRVPLASIKDDKRYSKVRLQLSASQDLPYNYEGDERINTFQRGAYRTSAEYEDMVDLWEVYLPRHKMVVTLPHDAVLGSVGETDYPGFDEAALEQREWIGPDSGPYHFLAFGCVPGNAMPKSPIQDLIDLHKVTNNLYTKLMRQGERQKELLGVQGQADTDGQRIIDASDGDVIRLDNPERSKVMSFGGANQNNLQLAIHLKDVFSYMAGNLDAMGGLSPQAKTLGQDKMLEASASRTVNDMQDTAIGFISEVCSALCWFWWHDPFKVMKVEHTVNNMPETAIMRRVHPAGAKTGPGGWPLPPHALKRDGDWDDMDLTVDPYSLQHQTPQGKLASLMSVVEKVIVPMQPILQQAGVTFDIAKLLQIMSDYMNLPELAEIVTIGEPPAQEAGPSDGMPEAGPGPSSTSREYVRRSLGGNNASTRQAVTANMTSGKGQSGVSSPQSPQ